MKNLTGKLLVLFFLFALIAGCNSDKVATGVIDDASMNTLTIFTGDGEHLTFSTENAEKSEAHGLLIGDTAKVYYKQDKEASVLLATKVIVTPAKSVEPELIGSWIEPVNGMPGQIQGVKLAENGDASSINMATLVYKSWERNGDDLILTGESIGNGQTIEFVDTFKIKDLSIDSLVLASRYSEIHYSKQK